MTSEVHVFGQFRFVPSARELWRGDRRVELPRRTFECLEYLIAHRDRAIGRDELVAAVFGRPNVSDAQLGQIVLRTRRALDDDGNTQHAIRTIAGFGYRWIAATVTTTDDLAPAPRSRAHGDDANAPSATAPQRRKRVALAAAAAALLVIGSATWLAFRGARAPTSADAREALHADSLVVLPIEVNGLREDGWVRLGGMDLVADPLREAGMTVPPSESVLTLLSRGTDAPTDP